VFHNCTPSGAHSFPADTAVCKCTRCDRDLFLKCEDNNKWYPPHGNACGEYEKCYFSLQKYTL
jgi:hypothetical protein